MAQLETLPYPGPPQRAAHAGDPGGPIGHEWGQDQLVMDSDGVVWRCTVSGLPGTWEQITVPSGASRHSLLMAVGG